MLIDWRDLSSAKEITCDVGIIGAGAAVVKDVASRAMVVGVPARDLRDRKMSSE